MAGAREDFHRGTRMSGDPRMNVISIFGALFSFNANAEIYYLDAKKPLIGHLKVPEAVKSQTSGQDF